MQNNYLASTKKYFDKSRKYFIYLFQKYLDSKMFILIDEAKFRCFNVKHGAAKKQLIQCCAQTYDAKSSYDFFCN